MGEGDQPIYSIGAVARMLDIPASTLRAWEERYAVITPTRSEGSHRLYSRSQVEKLRYLKGQMDAGISAADAHRLLSEELRGGSLPPATPDPATEAGPLILIAERDPYAAELADYFLRTEGWDVIIALDAVQAKLQFGERGPDVVLLDMLISGGAGFRLLNEFASQHKAHVIAISSLDFAEEAVRSGAAAFILKPLQPLVLVSTVRDLVGTSALVRPARKQSAGR
jgi:DNA-binding transcriptional MerR regulator